MTEQLDAKRKAAEGGRPQVIVALDFPSVDQALGLVDVLGGDAVWYKVGLELYARTGPAVVRTLRDRGKNVFVDLKLFDIPNTVAGAVASVADSGANMLTLHTSGGGPMLEAAAGVKATLGRDDFHLLGVTVLTSLSPTDVEATWGRSILSLRDEVVRLAELARDSGLDGVVASAFEALAIRRRIGQEPLIVTPGIRPSGGETHDQARVATPSLAAREGADFLVVGRAITQSDDPAAAWRMIDAELNGLSTMGAGGSAP